MTLKVIPTETNQHYSTTSGGIVHCWILTNDPSNALSEACYCVYQHDFDIEEIIDYPIVVVRDYFLEKDSGLSYYDKAQKDGIATAFLLVSKDGKTKKGPIALEVFHDPDLNHFLKQMNLSKNKGRCLHYEAGKRCGKIINAHSIQKETILREIAHNGHVYQLSFKAGKLKKYERRLSFQKKGINEVSIFRGFCETHDNELFEPIDNQPLIPTDQQAFLYGYRSLCRELFVKENASNFIENQLSFCLNQKAIRDTLLALKDGTDFGLRNLKAQKTWYDNSLINKNYSDVNYIVFTSSQKPFMAFSGLFYPDFDFMGRQLQDLGDCTSVLELISFCSAPMKSGWGFIFVWHKTSSNVCINFMSSLATMMCEGKKIEDMLFRLVVSNCENHAISPQWWENLSDTYKEQIIIRMRWMANSFISTPSSYLTEGLEGISGWEVDSVIEKKK